MLHGETPGQPERGVDTDIPKPDISDDETFVVTHDEIIMQNEHLERAERYEDNSKQLEMEIDVQIEDEELDGGDVKEWSVRGDIETGREQTTGEGVSGHQQGQTESRGGNGGISGERSTDLDSEVASMFSDINSEQKIESETEDYLDSREGTEFREENDVETEEAIEMKANYFDSAGESDWKMSEKPRSYSVDDFPALFEDDFDMRRVDGIYTHVQKNVKETSVAYQADEFGYARIEKYTQVLSEDGSVHMSYDEYYQHHPDKVTYMQVTDDLENQISMPKGETCLCADHIWNYLPL